MTTEMVRRGEGSAVGIHRESAAGSEIEVSGSTAADASVARAQAEVYGAMQLARKFPRDIDVARQRVLMACGRTRFAEKARYSVPRGKDREGNQLFIEGFSIRFAEEALRSLGNMYATTAVVFDDERRRIIRVGVIDLETNATAVAEGVVEKTVERKFLKRGQVEIAQRENSYGDIVYILPATDDEVRMKAGSEASKLLRNCVMRLLPADIAEEAADRIAETMKAEVAKDPAAARKRILDSFAEQGILADQLKDFVGQPIESLSPAQIDGLRKLFNAIKAGETTWGAVVADKAAAEPIKKPTSKPDAAPLPATQPAPEGGSPVPNVRTAKLKVISVNETAKGSDKGVEWVESTVGFSDGTYATTRDAKLAKEAESYSITEETTAVILKTSKGSAKPVLVSLKGE